MNEARCAIPFCGRRAEWIAEAGDETVCVKTPLCGDHHEALILEAIKNNPSASADVVRSCMERASYPVPQHTEGGKEG